jgi:hypothetical protein
LHKEFLYIPSLVWFLEFGKIWWSGSVSATLGFSVHLLCISVAIGLVAIPRPYGRPFVTVLAIPFGVATDANPI